YAGQAFQSYEEEHWIASSDPSRQRTIQTSHTGKVRQIVYTGGYSKTFGQEGTDHDPTTVVAKAPPPTSLSRGVDPNSLGMNPMTSYTELLKSGDVRSEEKTRIDGREVYSLLINQRNVGVVKYVVDSKTYFPVEYSLKALGGGGFTNHFVRFEILPSGAASEALLNPDPHPEP